MGIGIKIGDWAWELEIGDLGWGIEIRIENFRIGTRDGDIGDGIWDRDWGLELGIMDEDWELVNWN